MALDLDYTPINSVKNLKALRDVSMGGAYLTANTFTGIQTVSNTTDSTSVATGGIVTTGGLGVAKNITSLTLKTTGTTDSTSKTTGTIITAGGIGCGKDISAVNILLDTSVKVGGVKVIGAQGALIADLATTFTMNPLTATGSITVADGTTPSVAELGQYCVELEAKIEAILARLRAHGLIATA